MTAPTINSHVAGNGESNTTFNTGVPGGSAASGDLLITVVSTDGSDASTSNMTIIKQLNSSNNNKIAVAYRICTGSEGSTLGWSTSFKDNCAHHTYKILAAEWHGTSVPEVSTGATGTTSPADPDSLTASWGAEDNLWIAVCGSDDGRDPITGYPSGYGDTHATGVTGVQGVNAGIAAKGTTATATENPGGFTNVGENPAGV